MFYIKENKRIRESICDTHTESQFRIPPRMLLRQNINSAKKGEIRARFSLLFLLSFFFPMVPPINSLSLDPSRPNVYEEEKNRQRENKRDSKTEIETRRIPRTTHILSHSLEMYTHAEKERDKR